MTVRDNNASTLLITLTLSPEGSSEADIALVAAIGLDVSQALRARGDRIETPGTARTTRGGGDFVVTVITTVMQLASDMWTHKEIAEGMINDANSLVSLCKDAIAPIILAIAHAHKKHSATASSTGGTQPMRVTVEIDHRPVTVEAVDGKQIEVGLRIAQQFYERYPQEAARVSPKSQVKIQAHVPAQKQRKRR